MKADKIAPVLASAVLYGTAVATTFAPEVRAFFSTNFSPYQFGIPLQAFMTALSAIIFLPLIPLMYSLLRLTTYPQDRNLAILQAAAQSKPLPYINEVRRLKRTLLICSGYFGIIFFSWILYTSYRGI